MHHPVVSSLANSFSLSPSGKSGMPNLFTFGFLGAAAATPRTCNGSVVVEAMRRDGLKTASEATYDLANDIAAIPLLSLSILVRLILILGGLLFLSLNFLFFLLLSEDPADDLEDLVYLFCTRK